MKGTATTEEPSQKATGGTGKKLSSLSEKQIKIDVRNRGSTGGTTNRETAKSPRGWNALTRQWHRISEKLVVTISSTAATWKETVPTNKALAPIPALR